MADKRRRGPQDSLIITQDQVSPFSRANSCSALVSHHQRGRPMLWKAADC